MSDSEVTREIGKAPSSNESHTSKREMVGGRLMKAGSRKCDRIGEAFHAFSCDG